MSGKTRVGALMRQSAKTLSGAEAAGLMVKHIWEERQGRSGFLSAGEQQQIREAVALRPAAEIREYSQLLQASHRTCKLLSYAEAAAKVSVSLFL